MIFGLIALVLVFCVGIAATIPTENEKPRR